jgi:hypothetical protein
MRSRSPFWPVYAILFVAMVGLLIWLNLPDSSLPPQDMSRLLRDPWFVFGFCYFGFLLVPVAALMLADGQRRVTHWAWLAAPYFALGALPLSLYLAMRPGDESAVEQRWIRRVLNTSWFWWACAALTIVSAAALLPFGSLSQLIETMRHNWGWNFMWLDIILNHVLCLPLAQARMKERAVTNQGVWLTLIATTGPIGLCVYLAKGG